MREYEIFCSCCGKKVTTYCGDYKVYGSFLKKFLCCSKDCKHEIEMRDIASNIRQDYIPWSSKRKEDA
jgi:hypothetical protein